MRIGLVVTTAPFQSENWETAASIAEAAIDRGHEVAFFSIDGVYQSVQNCLHIGSWHGHAARAQGRDGRALEFLQFCKRQEAPTA